MPLEDRIRPENFREARILHVWSMASSMCIALVQHQPQLMLARGGGVGEDVSFPGRDGAARDSPIEVWYVLYIPRCIYSTYLYLWRCARS
jgi:hypothetical protein